MTDCQSRHRLEPSLHLMFQRQAQHLVRAVVDLVAEDERRKRLPRIRPTSRLERQHLQCDKWCVVLRDGRAWFGPTPQAAWRNFAGA